MKIRVKLLVNVVISIGLTSMLSLSFFVNITNLQKGYEYHNLAMETGQTVFDLTILSNDYLYFRLDRALIQWTEAYESGLSTLESLENLPTADQDLINEIRLDYENLGMLFQEEIENYNYKQKLINEGASEEELALVKEFQERKIAQLLIASQAIVSSSNHLQLETHKAVHEASVFNRKISILIFSILFAFIGISSIKLSNDITTPLSKLRNAVIKFGKGDLNAKAEVKAQGELGELATSFNEMARNLRDYKDQLETNEKRVKTILNAIPGGVDVLDKDLNILWANDQFAKTFGDNSVGGKCYDLHHPEKRLCGSKHLKPGETSTLTLSGPHGEIYEVTRAGMIYEDKSAIIEIFRDVTQKQKAEELLKRSEENLKRAQEIAHLGSWNLDLLKNHLTWSDEIYRIFGLAPQDFAATYEAFIERVHPDDREFVDRAYKKSVEENLPYDIEHRILRKNGEIRIVHERGITKYDKEGKAISSIGTVLDITDRKVAETTLEASKESLEVKVEELAQANAQDEAILHSIGEAVVACDTEGEIIVFNKVAQKLTGYSLEEALGQNHEEILNFVEDTPESSELNFISKTLKTGKPAPITSQVNLIQKNGTKVPISNNSCPIFDTQKNVIGCVLVFRDVTREQEIDKMKTEFVSVASHQLRTPLSVLFWALEEVLGEKSDNLNEKQKDYLRKALAANNRMIQLVNALLNIARLETGSLGLHPVPTNLADLSQKAIDEIKTSDQAEGCSLSLKLPKKPLPEIKIDPNLIREALNNILSNATKYHQADQKNRRIEVEIKMKETTIEISVQDNGIGIPKENQNRIFEKFFRASNAIALATDGTGLGLYITKLIIEASGGEIWIESPPHSKKSKTGTLVSFSLPIEGSKPRKGDKSLA